MRYRKSEIGALAWYPRHEAVLELRNLKLSASDQMENYRRLTAAAPRAERWCNKAETREGQAERPGNKRLQGGTPDAAKGVGPPLKRANATKQPGQPAPKPSRDTKRPQERPAVSS